MDGTNCLYQLRATTVCVCLHHALPATLARGTVTVAEHPLPGQPDVDTPGPCSLSLPKPGISQVCWSPTDRQCRYRWDWAQTPSASWPPLHALSASG